MPQDQTDKQRRPKRVDSVFFTDEYKFACQAADLGVQFNIYPAEARKRIPQQLLPFDAGPVSE